MKLSPREIGIGIIVAVVAGTATLVVDVTRRNQKLEEKVAVTNEFDECATADPIYSCLEEKIVLEATTRGSEAALALLEREVSRDPRFQLLCHSLTHETGHVAWDEKKDIAVAFEAAGTKGSTCASGFYHGVIESAVEFIPREKIFELAPVICDPFAVRPQSLDHYNCVHGLGHGLFALRQDKWPVALQDCATLKTTWEQESCASGVFMQNVVNEYETIGHYSDFKADDPLYPCTATEERWWRPCYLNQSSHVLYISDNDFVSVFEACAKAPESVRPICYQSSGRDVAGRYRTEDDELIRTCESAGDGAKDCIIGAVRDEVYFERGPVAGRALCAQTSGDIKIACESTVENDLKLL